MASSSSMKSGQGDGVFELLSDLCNKMAMKYCSQSKVSHKRLANKMRSQAYEIILKKSSKEIPCPKGEPIIQLLSHYLVIKRNVKNIAEFKRSRALKKIISNIRQTDYGENKEYIYNVLRLLVILSNSVKDDLSAELFQNPFSFGLLDEMLPKPERELFGSPQPYSYFPSHVFELPYSLKRQELQLDSQASRTYTEYTVESFDSRSFLPDNSSQKHGSVDIRSFQSPMSLASLTSSQVSPYNDNCTCNFPRLMAPRDIRIPSTLENSKPQISPPSTENCDVKEVFRAKSDEAFVDIWEIATQIDKDVPDDVWDVVCKMPPINERQLISSSPREMALWRSVHESEMNRLNIVSERQFIRHIMYLIIGVETSSFPFKEESQSFFMKENLVLEGISKEHITRYVNNLVLVGTYYKRLYKFAFNQSLEDHFHSHGLVYEAAREVVRRFLLEFRLTATSIFEECCQPGNEDIDCMPTLLQILFHMETLKYQIETVASIYKFIDLEPKAMIPYGAELMSYLFNEISMVTHQTTAHILFNSLFSICKIYFKFIEKFIFEGELDDRYNEFFIRKDAQNVQLSNKRYWDKGFHISQSLAVPDFLRPVAKFILLCGKSLRLLKQCNPSDPLVLLISSDHPSVKCCTSFEDLEQQQRVLDVYRTRCLFVSGEPMTFEQILLNREAERKAFAEMASIKQAKTMEKIVAERKRLAQLIIAEKQHSLRVLEAAMAEAKAAKQKSKHRERRRNELEASAGKAREEVDAKLRGDERNKIMEYYSKLNMEVEKSKVHTEWKMKRLQLDQTRIQLLSTEERNLKREKFELEHNKNEEIMAMSLQSDTFDEVNDSELTPEQKETEKLDNIAPLIIEKGEHSNQSELDKNKNKSKTSTDMFSAICNVAKTVFGVSRTNTNNKCDNKKELDAQGNVLPVDSDSNTNESQQSSNVIGADLNNDYDNIQYLEVREEAWKIKQKVMAHEFGRTDKENNQLDGRYRIPSIDEENNVWAGMNECFIEAKRNKLKVLGAEFALIPTQPKTTISEPITDAHREAIANKQKVLGVEYNIPLEFSYKKKTFNVAQEEALDNRKKALGTVRIKHDLSPKREMPKKTGLTLNLKPYSEMTSMTSGLTPNTGAITPGDMFPQLDLETPTTAEVALESAMTCDVFTPQVEDKLMENDSKPEKRFLTSKGFNFAILDDDEAVESEPIGDMQITPQTSPSKSLDLNEITNRKYSVFDLLHGSYSLEGFDPFGVRELAQFSKDHFTNKMDLERTESSYTHPALIMAEVSKRPYANIFSKQFSIEEEEQKTTCDNIATLTACLQRSVMLPLTYQLEVVNNSILTYFLVNLDMYEHLRSLKDYFFLMDGEFSRSICHNLFTRLVKTLNPLELLNFATLHNILDMALGSSISHVHKFSENLSFTITESPLSFQHSSPDVLQCLSLTYSVSWPLNIILSQEALLRYAKVFQFLIKMRRIFWVLGEDFESLKLAAKMAGKQSRKLHRSPHYLKIQTYRHNMAAMIRALDNYIVTTCILTSWKDFENDLKKAKTLDDLYDCHVVYIKKVLFRCLLNNRSTPVMKLLNDIFTVILKFSRLLKAGEWQHNESDGCYTHSNFTQLEEFFHLFEKLAKYLHKVVTKLMDCGYQRHLVELLTMVNLNGYYDSEKTRNENNTTIESKT